LSETIDVDRLYWAENIDFVQITIKISMFLLKIG